MTSTSAGLLLFRRQPELEVFIARMGGPFWAKKDAAAWSIPKGLVEPGEEPLATALREFGEEVGTLAPAAEYELLGEFPRSAGKLLTIYSGECLVPLQFGGSNLFELEWPPRSGRMQQFPEMIDARWVTVELARKKLVKGQHAVLEKLLSVVSG